MTAPPIDPSNPSELDFLSDLESDQDDPPTLINGLKMWLNVVVAITVIFVIMNSSPIRAIIANSLPNFGLVSGENNTPTTLGLVVSGIISGLLFVLYQYLTKIKN